MTCQFCLIIWYNINIRLLVVTWMQRVEASIRPTVIPIIIYITFCVTITFLLFYQYSRMSQWRKKQQFHLPIERCWIIVIITAIIIVLVIIVRRFSSTVIVWKGEHQNKYIHIYLKPQCQQRTSSQTTLARRSFINCMDKYIRVMDLPIELM